jgi:type I restriction enzyme R subunit
MNQVGQVERATQNRVIKLFVDSLDYGYLGNLEDQPNNSNIMDDLLHANLAARGYEERVISKAIAELKRTANNQADSLYDINKAVYKLLRYGVSVKPDVTKNYMNVKLVEWDNIGANDFAVAEEVSVTGDYGKRPDVVLYVNGIALGVIELKRSKVSVSEGIRQNLDNQKPEFIKHFFTTMQLVMAGNDTQGLRYGTIETPERYYSTWKEEGAEQPANSLDDHLAQICRKDRFLELIHNFIIFDAGTNRQSKTNW